MEQIIAEFFPEKMHIATAADMTKVAERLFQCILKMKNDKAIILAFQGNLGAGKTTLIKAFVEKFDISAERVTSPTFVMMKRFAIVGPGLLRNFIHIDTYRTESPAEIEQLGWADIVANPANIVCVEWPERIPALMPPNALHIMINYENTGEGRTIEVKPYGQN